MIYLRPQKTYRAPAISDGRNENELFPPTDQSRYRVVAEALRGRVISNDNPKLCFTALFFDARDGSELTERLRENGFRPGWYLDGKEVDASLITDGGYTLTIGKEQLTNAFVRLTLRTRDTDILLALVHPDYRPIYERVIAQGAISSVVIEQSEDLVNQILLDELNKSALTEIKRYFTLEISKKADKSELITPEQIKDLAHALDEERKVGGRNLIKHGEQEKRTWGEWASYTLYKPIEKSEPLTLSFDVLNVEVPPDGGAFLIYFFYYSNFRTEASVKYEEGKKRYNVTVSKLDFNYSLYGDKKNYDPNQVFIYPNSSYKSSGTGGCFTIANIKLERGNVATDWTPAPEDLLAELDKYTTLTQYNKNREEDSRKLDSKLDKPTSGKYILDKDIPSEFKKLVKVGGRNLIVTKRWKAGYLYGDSTNGSPGEPEYKVIPNFYKYRYDPTYIPTEGNTTITYKLYDNGGDKNGVIQLHGYDKDKKFLWWDVDGWRGEVGRTRTYTLPTDTRYIRLGVTNKDVRAKVEFGNVATDWTPAPEDTQSEIDALKQFVPTKKQKEWLDNMGQVLLADRTPSGTGGKKYHINGLSIDRSVFLRFSDGKPSALIGGKDAVLMAGVQNYGTDNLSVRTAIYQDGTAKFGETQTNEMIVGETEFGKVRVTSAFPDFIETAINSSVTNSTIFNENVYLTSSTKTKQYNFTVSNNATKLTITIARVTSEVYQEGSSIELLLDGVQIGSWRGSVSYENADSSDFVGGGPKLNIYKTPSVENNIKIERTLSKGNHTLLLRNSSSVSSEKGTFQGLNGKLYFDASRPHTLISPSGFRIFFNSGRYFDVFRDDKYVSGYRQGDRPIYATNPYIARVKGGMLVDKLTLEQPLDAPGCVLAGGEVDSNGLVTKSFGKYKKRQGYSEPKTTFDYNTHHYTIYHSIGNTNYIPIVTSRSSAWADLPRVMSVDRNSFTIAFINETNKVSDWRQPFIYTCYKAD